MKKLIVILLSVFLATVSVHAQDKRTLNMKDADIRALITQVADVTGYNFIVDPRIKGEVTVISSRPMDADEIYQVFLSILRVHGFSAVKTGNVVKVIPEARAKQTSIPTADGADLKSIGDEMVTQVLQVKNATASQLIPILRPLVPQYGHLAAYPPTNVVIISDRAANIERIVNIIQRIDKASDEEVDIIPLQNASAKDVVKLLGDLDKSSSPGPGDNRAKGIRYVADERTNSVLLTGEAAAKLRMRQLIGQLDKPLESTGNTQVIYLKYANALDLVPILDGITGTILDVSSDKGPAAIEPTEVTIQADEATNSLVISAPPDVARSLNEIIQRLDIRRSQVLVEAIIAEVEFDKLKELGVQWAMNGNGIFGGQQFGNTANSGPNIGQVIDIVTAVKNGEDIPENAAATVLGTGGSLGIGKFELDLKGFSISALVRALDNKAKANILSTPSLMTLDNVEAEIVVGQNVPFITGSFANTGDAGDPQNPFQTIEREDIGVKLKITPHINEGGAITLDIEQEVSNIADGVNGQADLITNTRNIKTTILVDDGETIVLGGLIDNVQRETIEKVPLLGDIPLLGYLFQSRSTTRDRNALMVFLRTKVLRDGQTAYDVTRERYETIRGEQLIRRERGVQLMPKDPAPLLPEWGEPVLALPPSYEAYLGE